MSANGTSDVNLLHVFIRWHIMIWVTSDESKEHKGSYGLEQVSRIRSYFWVKENERTIAFVQTYRMGNSFPNPMYVDDILLASGDVNLLPAEKRSSCPQKSILDRVSLVISIEIHWEKKKRGIRNITWTCWEEVSKACMSRKPTPVLIDKGNGIGNFSVLRDNIEWIKWIWYHMLPLLVAQYYPTIHVSGLFWQYPIQI